MKRILTFLLLFLVVLIGLSSFFWLYEVKFIVGRANVSTSSFSIDNSYLFITPLRARANAQEKIRITVFVLNNQGLGVMGKKVSISPDASLTIETVQGLTDSYGKAFFDVSSNRSGEFYLEISVSGAPLKQKAHLSFY